jgi:peptidoglycan/LPS O-acetylase OafA/YrhL
VISGYLMFSVIEFGLKRHEFSVAVFYKKRILRILPALACMIAIVLIFAYFLLFFFDYGHLSAAGSTYFVSDILEPKVRFLGDAN